MSRYGNKEKVLNENELYERQFESRDVNSIIQFKMEAISYPTLEEKSLIQEVNYRWKPTDRLYRIANEYYGDHRKWWIIAQYNKIGSELEIKTNQIIKIPRPLSIVLQYIR